MWTTGDGCTKMYIVRTAGGFLRGEQLCIGMMSEKTQRNSSGEADLAEQHRKEDKGGCKGELSKICLAERFSQIYATSESKRGHKYNRVSSYTTLPMLYSCCQHWYT